MQWPSQCMLGGERPTRGPDNEGLHDPRDGAPLAGGFRAFAFLSREFLTLRASPPAHPETTPRRVV
eukprot:552767-Pyramimonas_sp.AAC.1